MRREVEAAAVNSDAERLCGRKLKLLVGQRDADAMGDFLRSLGVYAAPSEDGSVIAFDAHDAAAAQEIYNGLVCFIAASVYRFQAELMVLTASGARSADKSSSGIT